jgi:hypothetical protein
MSSAANWPGESQVPRATLYLGSSIADLKNNIRQCISIGRNAIAPLTGATGQAEQE